MRLLAINFGGLGDEVLFLPTLQSIKAKHPDWEITLLTEPRSKSIAQLSSLIDKNIVFDVKKIPLTPADYIALVSLLRAGKYDIVVSSGSSTKVSILLFLTGIKQRIGYDSGALSRMLLSRAVKLNKEQYAGFMLHDLVKGLDIQSLPAAPNIDLSEAALSPMKEFLEQERQRKATISGSRTPRKLVLLHPGTSRLALRKGIFKTWSSANWSELSQRLLALDCEVLLCGGPDDDATIRDITSKIGTDVDSHGGHFINAYGKTASVIDLAALMKLSDLIICVDSAPMHIASALQKRLIGLFGPTDPQKLLLQGPHAIALAESAQATAQNKQQADKVSSGFGSGSEISVQIPLDIVYQTAVDQLNQV